MLRPLLAFACLALTAFLLAPTVQSVHEQVEDLDIKRDLPRLWKWDKQEPPILLPPICDDQIHPLFSEVDEWPTRIRKNETFTLGGFVTVGDAEGRGVAGVIVDLFLNETKELPGDPLGTATTGGDGRFTLTTSVPFELQATKYHLVAHAHDKRDGCTVYKEHWSDPEMEVTSPTRIVLYSPQDAVAGHPFVLRGMVLDSVGAPVRNANVTLSLDGESRRVRTNDAGLFETNHTVSSPRTVKWSASFAGTEYYGGSKADASIAVTKDALRLDAGSFELVRGRVSDFSGRLVLPPGHEAKPLTFTFDGVRVATCAGCPANASHTVTPADGGTFRLRLVAPSDQQPGPFQVVVKGGGLEEPETLEGRLLVPVFLSVETENQGPVGRGLDGTARLVDEAGRPFVGPIAILAGDRWVSGSSDASGNFTFSAASACGTQSVRALYNGTGTTLPAVAEDQVEVCPLLAAIPPWLLAIPWWGWALLGLLPFLVVWAIRRWRNAAAPVISRGPPLTLLHTGPKDAAAGIVGIGETASLTAFLEEPLPKGHALRIGLARRTQPVEVGPDLRAEFHVTPDKMGEVPVRAEILDPRGRVVTRRTAVVRVVRYAEEIESRYRRLRGETGASEAVSPREFEAWLARRSPDLDPAVAARLVAVFEEADYGPRTAGRPELVAYVEAEAAIEEVKARVLA